MLSHGLEEGGRAQTIRLPAFSEFRPGEPWKGYPNIDPETDPYVTPGSVINNLSVNTVREVDHLRDRNSGTWDAVCEGLPAT